jgi:hypothetical protein
VLLGGGGAEGGQRGCLVGRGADGGLVTSSTHPHTQQMCGRTCFQGGVAAAAGCVLWSRVRPDDVMRDENAARQAANPRPRQSTCSLTPGAPITAPPMPSIYPLSPRICALPWPAPPPTKHEHTSRPLANTAGSNPKFCLKSTGTPTRRPQPPKPPLTAVYSDCQSLQALSGSSSTWPNLGSPGWQAGGIVKLGGPRLGNAVGLNGRPRGQQEAGCQQNTIGSLVPGPFGLPTARPALGAPWHPAPSPNCQQRPDASPQRSPKLSVTNSSCWAQQSRTI